MPSPDQGILSPQDFNEVKLSANTADTEWNPVWKPRHRRRALSRLRSLFFWPRSSGSQQQQQQERRLRSTAWLDGLRGFAALMVYIHHHELWVHDQSGLYQNKQFENGFGYEGHYRFVAFPFVRNFFTGGHFAVTTFYVISGYVLSLKALGLIRLGDTQALGDHLASALFRRWLRLYLPIIIFMTIFVSTWHIFPFWTPRIEQEGSWRAELWSLYCELKNFSFIYKEGTVPWIRQHFHLWSIPVEFRGSIVIYTTLLAISRTPFHTQLWTQVGLIFYFLYITDGWYCAMFVAGMLICQLDLAAQKGELPRFLARLEPYRSFIYYHLLALSLYLGGVPSATQSIEALSEMRGWHYLSWLKPQAVFDYKWFYLFWAATTLVASVPRISWLKSFFETRGCQYLGRVSYALYMVHGPVLWTIGDRLYVLVGWYMDEHTEHVPGWINKVPIPRSGPMGLELSFLLPQLILLPLTFFMAEIVTRSIDTPSVRFASWLYKKATATAGPQLASPKQRPS